MSIQCQYMFVEHYSKTAILRGEFDFVLVSYTSICLACTDNENIQKVSWIS